MNSTENNKSYISDKKTKNDNITTPPINADDISFSIEKKTTPQSANKYLNVVKKIWTEAKFEEVSHLYAQNDKYYGRELLLKGKRCLNFGSCGYFGLEFDQRLRNAAKQAIDQFGTQFAFPPVYISLNVYEQLKEKYTKIFGSNVILGSTTTLSHLSCIPVMIQNDDVVLLDQQVHNSIQMAAQLVTNRGVKVKLVSHNDMNVLENRIKQLRKVHRRIWYFADGIYSMYGDEVPVKDLQSLQKTYPELYLYIDDAHGMSWAGKHGRGYVLNQIKSLERTIVLISHAKCFGSAGGSIVLNNPELEYQIKNFGPTMIFSGPMQPALLGASLASADIHLSDEIYQLQDKLINKIRLRNRLIKKAELPVMGPYESPICFLGVGSPKATGELVEALINEGFYTNISLFPAVSKNRSGIRFTTTCIQEDEDIQNFIEIVSVKLKEILKKHGTSLSEIKRKFSSSS
jgi:7-keto-8-aminopelargonate synthetase-like enzyme